VSSIDRQIGGDHYKQLGCYQPWEIAAATFTEEEMRGAMKLKVIKYLLRNKTCSREDIEKAHHTMGLYLELTS